MVLKLKQLYDVPVTLTVRVAVEGYGKDDAYDRVASSYFEVINDTLSPDDLGVSIGEPENIEGDPYNEAL